MARHIKIAAAQLGPLHKADSRAVAVSRLVKLLRDAHGMGAKFVVFPELALTTSAVWRRSRPSFEAIAIASQPAARLAAASMLLTTFMREPSPARRLIRKHFAVVASMTARQPSNAVSLPAAIMLSVPAVARAGPPEIGASSMAIPSADNCPAMSSASAGSGTRRRMKLPSRDRSAATISEI